MSIEKKSLALCLVIAISVFAVDQASKWWVLEIVDLRERGFIEVLPFFNLALAWNTGVNFGLFSGGSQIQQYLLAAFAVIVSLVLLGWSAKSADRRLAVAAGLIVGGALGNALDRLVEGAVVDFLNFDCCGIGNPYAFNIADTAIFFGAVGVAALVWRSDAKETADRDVGNH